jgi:acyl-CoA thioesterase
MSKNVLEAIKKMVANEPYARKLGIQLIKVEPGYALVEMDVTDDVANINNITHGGAIFSLIDEAFEISSNSHGTIAVALNMTVSFHRAPKKGEVLRAESKEIHLSRRTATYDIKVTEGEERLVASCQAMVYRKQEKLPFL